ncbi:hypothetical protein D3C72_1744680 [compost metagenome]
MGTGGSTEDSGLAPLRTSAPGVPMRPCASSIFSSTALRPASDSVHFLPPLAVTVASSLLSSSGSTARIWPWSKLAVPASRPDKAALPTLKRSGPLALPSSPICSWMSRPVFGPAARVISIDTCWCSPPSAW